MAGIASFRRWQIGRSELGSVIPQEAEGAGPLGSGTREPKYVRVTNPVWNGSGWIDRKKADRYVVEGRGRFTGGSTFELDLRHPHNIATAKSARLKEARATRGMVYAPMIGLSDRCSVLKLERKADK